MKSLIYTSYSPNTRFKDLLLNKLLLFYPPLWKRGNGQKIVSDWFSRQYNNSNVFAFNYARSGMYVLYKSLFNSFGGSRETSVAIQGFTCVAAVNPVKWAGYKITYIDIDKNSLNMSLEDLKKKITPSTKIVMFQHTFGNSNGIEEVAQFCKERNLILIEDCANTILGKHNDNLIGTFGDAAIFSLGRDKAVSGVDGGVILINNSKLLENFNKEYAKLDYPRTGWIFHELLYPLIWTMIKTTYTIKFGLLIHLIFTKLGLLQKATTPEEKQGLQKGFEIALLPNALAMLANLQLKDLEKINKHRQKIAELYENSLDNLEIIKFHEGNVPLRFPLLVNNGANFINNALKENIILGDWYNVPVAPIDTNLENAGYQIGMCPNAEEICKKIVNLPTHINMTEKKATRIIKFIKENIGS